MAPDHPTPDVLDALYAVIRQRIDQLPPGSYVTTLVRDGSTDAVAAKIREEADELIEAADGDDPDHVAAEAADLLFHTIVLLGMAQVPPSAPLEVLRQRFGIGGLDEKRSRQDAPREDST